MHMMTIFVSQNIHIYTYSNASTISYSIYIDSAEKMFIEFESKQHVQKTTKERPRSITSSPLLLDASVILDQPMI